MKNKILTVSALFALTALSPLHAMEAEVAGNPEAPYNPISDLKQLLYWNMGDGPAGKQFGESTFAVKTGSSSAAFNTVFAYPTTTEADVQAVEEYMEGVPFSWWVGPDHYGVRELLEQKGFVFSHTEYQMSTTIKDNEKKSSQQDGLSETKAECSENRIDRVVNLKDFEVWVEVSAKGLGLPLGDVKSFFSYVFENADLYRFMFLTAYYNDEPVSTGIITTNFGYNAVLHLVSTIEEHPGTLQPLVSELLRPAWLDASYPVLLLAPSQVYHDWFIACNANPFKPFKDVQAYDVYTKGDAVQGTPTPVRGCQIF